MSTPRSSSPAAFDAEAFRRQLASRLSLAPSGSGDSISSSVAHQPPPRSSSSGRSDTLRGVGLSGPTVPVRSGGLSGGGLSGKSSSKFTVSLVPSFCCRGSVSSSVWGAVMCAKLKCSYRYHTDSKVEDFPDEPVYCLAVGSRDLVFPSPCIRKTDCTVEMEDMLRQLELSGMEEWEEVCRVAAEEVERQRPSEEVPVKKEVEEYSEVLGLTLKEVTNVPSLSYAAPELPEEENGDEAEDKDPKMAALRNILAFTDDAVMVNGYTSMAIVELVENQTTIAEKLDVLAQVVFRVADVVGDREFIREHYSSLAEAVYDLKNEGRTLESDFRDVDIKVDDLEDRLNQKIEIISEESVNAMEEIQRNMATPNVTSSGGDLSAVLDNAGRLHPDLQIGMVNGKCFTLRELILKVQKHEEELDDIRSIIDAKGGVSLGQFKFDSPDALAQIIRSELPNGVPPGLFRCFVDAITLFVLSDEPSSTEQSSYKKLNPDLTAKDCALIHQMHRATCPPYTGSATTFTAGEHIDCFKKPEAWDGDALDGKQTAIANAAEKSAEKLEGLTNSLLKHSPTLLALSLVMGDKSEKWHTKFHAHLAKELRVLSKLKLPVEDIFLLFSDLFRLIVELFHSERASVHAIDDKVDSVERLTTIIWTSLKVHGLMQDFLDAKFKNHQIVQAAFVRFLTTKIGQNTAAALSSDMKKLDRKVTAVETKVTSVNTKATAAENLARSVDQQLSSLKSKNPQWNR
eukprot:scaffold8081_cov83-Skeletonema_menzelii.AAC.3